MSEIRWYKITPADSWFFRDSRPANAGEDQSDLQSIFPPHPQTVVGAIRAALARTMGWQSGQWNDDIKSKLGDGFDDVSPLRFTPPMLALGSGKGLQLLFSAPRHLIGEMEFNDRATGIPLPVFHPRDWLRPSPERFVTDMGRVHLPMYPEHGGQEPTRLKSADEFFITTHGMQCVLDGNKPEPQELIHQSRLFAIESRVGIDRDPLRRAMYSPGHVRLAENASLVIGLSGLNDELELPSAFPLGGESRQTVCQRMPQAPQLPQSRTGGCVVLATPACWKGCWHGAGPGDSANGLHPSLTAHVTTCTVERPTHIGGFDSRNTSPQTLKAYCPTGSVWWLDEPASPPDDEWCLAVGQRTSLGYGVALLGQIPST